jgi:hypothetical protein
VLCLGSKQGCCSDECRKQAMVPQGVVCSGSMANVLGNRVPSCVLERGFNHQHLAYQGSRIKDFEHQGKLHRHSYVSLLQGGGGAFDDGLGKLEGGVKQTSAHPHLSDKIL